MHYPLHILALALSSSILPFASGNIVNARNGGETSLETRANNVQAAAGLPRSDPRAVSRDLQSATAKNLDPEDDFETESKVLPRAKKDPFASGAGKKALAKLTKDDRTCVAAANRAAGTKLRRSVKLDKRVNYNDPNRPNPGDVLFDAKQLCKIVEQDDTDYLEWTEGDFAGTYGLCGCTGIAIVGRRGVIVSHLNPRDPGETGKDYYKHHFDQIKHKFDHELKKDAIYGAHVFQPENGGKALGEFNGESPAIRVEKWIKDTLKIKVSREGYEMGDANDRNPAKLGTMLVQLAKLPSDPNQSQVYVWINNRRTQNP